MAEVFKRSLIAGLIVLILDGLIHYFFTPTSETYVYYLFGGFTAFYTIWYLLKYNKTKFRHIIFGALYFVIIFGIYYRLLEAIQGKPFGSRVPDITLLGNTYSFMGNPIISMILWTLGHGSIFILAFYMSKPILNFFRRYG